MAFETLLDKVAIPKNRFYHGCPISDAAAMQYKKYWMTDILPAKTLTWFLLGIGETTLFLFSRDAAT